MPTSTPCWPASHCDDTVINAVIDTADVLADATRRLAHAGVASPRVDAEYLLAHCAGVARPRLLSLREITAAQATAFELLVERRARREPLQYLLGTVAFRHIELAVGPGVFIPRPETELLVDAVLPVLRTVEQDARPIVVDLCAGSGALAVAVADEGPGVRVIAVERDPAALRWLRRNTAGTGVEVVAADIADPGLLPELRGCANAVLCNPPYVPAATPVDPEVLADPAGAVFAGADGLQLMPAVIARAADLLRTGGVAAVEHDDTHGSALPRLLHADGRWAEINDHRDLSGRPRYVTAIRA